MGRPATPLAVRFWQKVDRRGDGECWPWTAHTAMGYGRINLGPENRTRFAHRVSWELNVGPIPEGLTIDHLCRNRLCVNPAHLEPVTMGVNVLRGNTITARNARKTHCVRGHEFTPENTYLMPNGGGRSCIECGRFNQSGIAERKHRFVRRIRRH